MQLYYKCFQINIIYLVVIFEKFCQYTYKLYNDCYIDKRFIKILFYDYIIVKIGVHYFKYAHT